MKIREKYKFKHVIVQSSYFIVLDLGDKNCTLIKNYSRQRGLTFIARILRTKS